MFNIPSSFENLLKPSCHKTSTHASANKNTDVNQMWKELNEETLLTIHDYSDET